MANSNGWGDGAANNAIGWGQGANNNIGWGDSHAKSWAGATDIVGLTTDSDAQAFITAAAITDPTQISAINNLVVGMKADGLWTKMKAIYPFVGGTATTHKYNLKDPRDLDAAFRLVFNGGWTHSSNGATPNGTNGYADTKLNSLNNLSLNNYAFGYYSRTNNTNVTLIGSESTTILTISPRGNTTILAGGSNFGLVNFSDTNSLGFYQLSRNQSNLFKGYKNNILKGTDITSTGGNLPNLNVYLGALNKNLSALFYDNREVAFSYLGDGLTDTEASNLYTRVQTYQTALSRQV
jgi:hypothetical protein